jgi:ATP-dependent Clp protease ATP-binding subunit ClpA
VLTFAQGEAERQPQSYIGTEHLVLGLMADQDSIAGKALRELGVDEVRLRRDIEAIGTGRTDSLTQITPTSPVKKVIEISFEEARRDGTDYVGTEHMLMALIIEGDDSGAKLLMAQGVTLDRARSVVDRLRAAGATEGRYTPRPFASSVESILTSYPVERFSGSAQVAIVLAADEAERSNHSYLGTEHLIVGLMRGDCIASSALRATGIELESVRHAVESVLGRSERTIVQQIVPTSRVQKIFRIAVDDAGTENSPNVDTAHLLMALLTEGQGIAAHVLKDLGITPVRAKQEIDRLRKSGTEEPGGPPPTRHGYRHVDVQDSQGRRIGVDVIFPPGYPGDESDSVIARIKKAFDR